MSNRTVRHAILVVCFCLTAIGYGAAQPPVASPQEPTATAQGGEPVTWRAVGFGVGGANFAVAFHPEDPQIMLTH